MNNILFSSKLFVVLVTLLAFPGRGYAQLPPVFDTAAYAGVEVSGRTTTYLPPTRIVWKETKGNSAIQNEHYLLQKGLGQADLAHRNESLFKSDGSNTPSIILDFGKELQGGVRIVTGNLTASQPAQLRVRFGESVSETMASIGEKGATNDHAIRDAVLDIPRWGVVEFGNTGFRFIRIDLVTPDTELYLEEVSAKFIYQDIPYLGSFNSSDELLNKIWMTGAYTVHLNMQDYLWDGIKRDRLVWIGDIHPEVSTVNAVFGYNAAVPRSLDLARDNTPLPNWMNGHSSYSLWWIITHKDWFMANGDLTYLQQQKAYLLPLLRRLISLIDENGKEQLDGVRFLDWPSSANPEAIHAGLQALLIRGLSDGKDLCMFLNEPAAAAECEEAIIRLKRYTPEPAGSKQAAALLSLAGLLDTQKASTLLTDKGVHNFSTFYGYYMLEALAKASKHEEAIASIRNYWGGMLSVGATTFWEDFDINWLKNASPIDEVPQPGKVDIHATYGDYCYLGLRHSLCHGWASGPTAWLSEHVLGVKVVEPGCKTIRIAPNLGNLEFVEGSYPTPLGVVKIKHVKQADGRIASTIDAPEGITILQ